MTDRDGPDARRRFVSRALIILWIGSLTLTMQLWIGRSTIYAAERVATVEAVHDMILANTAPANGWGALGLNGVNVRVGAVYVAEAMHRLLHLSITRSYLLLDTVALFGALCLLRSYLRRFQPEPYALLGVAFVGTVLPLTYQLFYFHPWDRLSLFLWILLLGLLHRGRVLLAAALLPLAVAVKYDIMLLPAVYGIHNVLRDRRISALALRQSAAMLALGFGTYVALNLLLPGGSAPAPILGQLSINIHDLRAMHIAYPPLLGFVIPIATAAIGFRRCDAWSQAGVLLGAALLVPLALRSNLAEFRAQMAILVLLAPASLAGVRYLTNHGKTSE